VAIGVNVNSRPQSVGHGAVLYKDEVAVIYGNQLAFALPQSMNAGHNERAVLGLVIEVPHTMQPDLTLHAIQDGRSTDFRREGINRVECSLVQLAIREGTAPRQGLTGGRQD
jgi:hypothetical protein